MSGIKSVPNGVTRGFWDKLLDRKVMIAEMPHGIDRTGGLENKRIVFRLRMKGDGDSATEAFWEDPKLFDAEVSADQKIEIKKRIKCEVIDFQCPHLYLNS